MRCKKSLPLASLSLFVLAAGSWQFALGQTTDWTAREKEIYNEKLKKHQATAKVVIDSNMPTLVSTTKEIVETWGKVQKAPTPVQTRQISDAQFKHLQAVTTLQVMTATFDPGDKQQADVIKKVSDAIDAAKGAILAAKTLALQGGIQSGGSDPNIIYSDANPADPQFLDKAKKAVEAMVKAEAGVYDEKRDFVKKDAELFKASLLVEARNQVDSEKAKAGAAGRAVADRGTEGGPTPKGLQWIVAKRVGGNEANHRVSLDPDAITGGSFGGKGTPICRTLVNGSWLIGWTDLGRSGFEGCVVRVGSKRSLQKDFDVLVPEKSGVLPALSWQMIDRNKDKDQKPPAGAVAMGRLADGTVPTMCRAEESISPGNTYTGHVNPERFICQFAAHRDAATNFAYEVLVEATSAKTQAVQPAPAPAASPAAQAKPAAALVIKVLQARYGVNCKAVKPDVTAHLATVCNGKETCDYTVNAGAIGDTAPGCAKAYEASYECTAGKSLTAALPAEASGKSIRLSCK